MFHCHELVVQCSDGLLMASQLHNLICGNPDPLPFFPFLTCGLRAVRYANVHSGVDTFVVSQLCTKAPDIKMTSDEDQGG